MRNGNMVRYILGRVAGVIGALVAVSIIVFLMMHAVPGGPFDASQLQELPLPERTRQALLASYGLDKPLYQQYVVYMAGAVRGDFGVSFRYGEAVTTFVRRNWPATMQLGLATLALALPVGLAMGMASALRPNTWVDYVSSVFVVTGIVVPSFVVAILLIVIFSVKLRWLPTGGWGAPAQMILPVITYALGPTATIARYTRSSVIEALRTDHVRTAYAKGLPTHLVLLRHALRNALIPLTTVIGPIVVWMIVGSFFVETIFRIPGIGSQLTIAIYNRDYPLIMALTLMWSAAVACAYLATDLLYVVFDPRIRLAGGEKRWA
jgi:ABC-type dipeptide/oligopeptide/nickel transport system permease component